MIEMIEGIDKVKTRGRGEMGTRGLFEIGFMGLKGLKGLKGSGLMSLRVQMPSAFNALRLMLCVQGFKCSFIQLFSKFNF